MVAPTPWFQRSFHFDFPVGLFPVVFSRLEGSLFRLNALLQNAGVGVLITASSGNLG